MRRFVFGLSLVSAAAGILLFAACEKQEDVLRVVSINGGATIYCDLADWQVFNDPTIPDSEEDFEFSYVVPVDTALFEFAYVEIGAGLPTWTPFHADINEYTITYESQMSSGYSYMDWTVPLTYTIPVDRETKKTTLATLVVADAWWKIANFEADIGDYPGDAGLLDIVRGDIEFTAIDSVSGRTIKAQGQMQLEFGDFWDDPERLGQ